MTFSPRTRISATLSLTALLAGSAAAQCSGHWLPDFHFPGFDSVVYAAVPWDPDGPGPLPPCIVMAGAFHIAGNAVTDAIAAYDPVAESFAPIGGGILGTVRCLAVLPNGTLVAGGSFTTAGGVPANRIAAWDGSQWSPLGAGRPATVETLTVTAAGTLIATSANYFAESDMASWDGTTWTQIHGAPPAVTAVAALPNGDLAVGTETNGATSTSVHRWNGTTWTTIGGAFDNAVHSLIAAPGGELFAGGRFSTAGGQPAARIASWNGTSWAQVGAGLPWNATRPVQAMVFRPNGNLVLCGATQNGGANAPNLAEWEGTNWTQPLVGPNSDLTCLALAPNGDVIVGGGFHFVNNQPMRSGARWDGSNWRALIAGTDGDVVTVATLPDGSLVCTGTFTVIGGIAANRIARWDGAVWSPLGSGLNNLGMTLCVRQNGDLIVGGSFTTAGGISAPYVARWDGANWHGMGSPGGPVSAMLEFQGTLVVNGGNVNAPLRRESGGGWVPFGPAGAVVDCMGLSAAGTLYIGGRVPNGIFSQCSLGRFDGTWWWPEPALLHGFPKQILALPDGRLGIVGGGLGNASGPFEPVVAFDGTTIQGLGCPLPSARCATLLPDGRLVVGNATTIGSMQTASLAVHDGASWSQFGVGVPSPISIEYLGGLTVLPSGDLAVGGGFRGLDGVASTYIAVWRPDCPATAIPFGTGCAGGAGPVSLTSTRAPWIGGAGEARVEGLAPLTLLVSVYGFQQIALPLDLVFAEAGTGCVAWTTGDFLGVQLPTGSSATTTLPVPDSPALVGATIHHYALPFEFTAGGAVAQITSSNALSLTIGTFGY